MVHCVYCVSIKVFAMRVRCGGCSSFASIMCITTSITTGCGASTDILRCNVQSRDGAETVSETDVGEDTDAPLGGH